MPSKRLNGKALAAALEATAGLTFRDHERLRRALTHASARSKDAGTDYERMEFLGDRVLGLVVAEFLYETFPEASEGELSLRLNAMVNAETLAAISEEIGLPDADQCRQRDAQRRRPQARQFARRRAGIADRRDLPRRRAGRGAQLHRAPLVGALERRSARRAATPRPSCRNGRIRSAAACRST